MDYIVNQMLQRAELFITVSSQAIIVFGLPFKDYQTCFLVTIYYYDELLLLLECMVYPWLNSLVYLCCLQFFFSFYSI
ncbi:hypothetical protein ES332_D02G188900v1 [Gossypium tomentosum]|uniref:Uncharacterized protein n=1 Tax=Gossypium tomentosum TaxID=34277 RepID=A0A5D2LZ44_GOSTO|nr:hypothetical protein ES332_D02G188900v1 [Gossypium tomentosum]TYH84308.1 hypothetical protein ES332_D02G188900v1 [Gossypium tomentosum]